VAETTQEQLEQDFAKAKARLRKASRTFNAVGRLRAFMRERSNPAKDLTPEAAPLEAMKYILKLEGRLKTRE
jgi:hypothetical protein